MSWSLFNLIANVVGWYLILRYVAPRVVRFLIGNPEVAKGGASVLIRLVRRLVK